jgi:hypothetical protein
MMLSYIETERAEVGEAMVSAAGRCQLGGSFGAAAEYISETHNRCKLVKDVSIALIQRAAPVRRRLDEACDSRRKRSYIPI